MYLTYDEYQSMGGTLDFTTYSDLEFEAEAAINWYTFSRLKNDLVIPEAVKRVMKRLIDLAQEKAGLMSAGDDGSGSGTSAAIASQSNDGVSVSYNVLSASELMNSIKEQESTTIKRYLQDVTNEAGQKLLYRGLYPNE